MFWMRRKRNGTVTRSAVLALEQWGSVWGASSTPRLCRPPLQAEVLEVRVTPTIYTTSTALNSVPNPSQVGQPVTLTTFTLAHDPVFGFPFAPPAGTDVIFYNDAKTGSVEVGRSTTDSNGQAKVSITTLPAGVHSLRAQFVGVTIYNPFGFDPYDTFAPSEGTSTQTVEVANTPPTISDIPNQTVPAGGGTLGSIPFTVGDAETATDKLAVTAVASDTKLITTVAVGGTGASRTLVVAMAPGQVGTATITVTVSDGTATATDTFNVVLTQPPPPPSPPPPPPPPAFVDTKRPRLYATGTDAGVPGDARLHNPDGSVRLLVRPYGDTFTGGVRVSVGDVTGDGVPDLVTAPGPGTMKVLNTALHHMPGGPAYYDVAPTVVVFSGTDGQRVGEFQAFESSFTGGVYVATADFNYDGVDEIVVSPDESGGPRVRVLRGTNGSGVVADFFGIEDPSFRGGVRVAAGDANGDLVPDLIVAAGFGGGPRIAVFNGASALTSGSAPTRLVGDFFAFEPSLRNGAYVAAGDLSGDGRADLVFGGGPGGGPRILALDGWGLVRSNGAERRELVNTFAFDPAQRGGVRVGASDYNGDGRVDLLASPGPGGGDAVRAFNGPTFNGGSQVGGSVGGSGGLFLGPEPTPPGALYQFGDEPGALTQMVLEAARDNILSSIYDMEYLAQYEGEAFDDDAFLDDAYEQLDQIEEEISRLEQPPPAAEDVPLGPGDFGPTGVPIYPDYSVPARIASDSTLAQGTDGTSSLDSALAQILDLYNRSGADAFERGGNAVSRVSGRPEPAIVGLGTSMLIRTGTTQILRQNLPTEQVNRLWPQQNNLPVNLRTNANAARAATSPLFRAWQGTKGGGDYRYSLTVGPNGISLSVTGRLDQLIDTGSGSSYQFQLGADGRSFSARIHGFRVSQGGGVPETRDVTVTGVLSSDGRTLDLGVNGLPVTMR